MMNDYQQWMNYWSDSLKQNFDTMNSFSNMGKTPHFGSPGNIFGGFEAPDFEKMQSMFNPGNFSAFFGKDNPFGGNFSSLNSLGLSHLNIMANHLFGDLQQAVYNNDLKKQREILKRLSDNWFEQTAGSAFSKNIEMFKWHQESLELMLKRKEFEHFENEVNRETRLYLISLNELYGSIIRLQETFKGLDQKVADGFVNLVLREDHDIADAMQLFDDWTAEFETFYKKLTFSDSYQQSFALFVKAISEAKKMSQKLIDRQIENFGLPSNREMDSVHKKIHTLQKSLRQTQRETSGSSGKGVGKKELEELQTALKQKEKKIAKLEQQVTDLIKTAKEQQKVLESILDEQSKAAQGATKTTSAKSSAKKSGGSAKK